MKRILKSKKGIALLATLALAIGGGGAALAYFTDAGSGTGTASVGSSTQFTVYGTVSGSSLYPGAAGVTVPITVTNNGSGSQKVGTVTLDSITADAGHASCITTLNASGSAFTFANPVTINQDLAASATSTAVNGTLVMNDTGVSQDSCQGALLTLNFTEHNAS